MFSVIITTLINWIAFLFFFFLYTSKEKKRLIKKDKEIANYQESIITARKRNKPYCDFLENEKKVYSFSKNDYNSGVLKSLNLAIEKASVSPDISIEGELKWINALIIDFEVESKLNPSTYSEGLIYGLKIAKSRLHKQIKN